MRKDIEVIAFDADDTLWINEPKFRETEEKFCQLLKDHLPAETVSAELYKTETANMALYGYGAKAFVLSMIETLLRITDHRTGAELVQKVIAMGKELLQQPVEVLDGVKEVLIQLNGNYRLVVATKGDLLDQERKLLHSGLEEHFHHIEIMSDKQTDNYRKLLKNIGCQPEHFLMVGNSLKSDVLPVLELGGYAVHIPFHVTWAFEEVENTIDSPRFLEAKHISELLTMLA